MAQNIRPPVYSPAKFVDRKDEIEFILEKVQRLPYGLEKRERLLIFVGGRGTGKTWLLRRLKDELRDLGTPLDIFFLDLARYWSKAPSVAVMEILLDAAQEVLGPGGLPGDIPSEVARRFMDRLRPRLEERPLVALVDAVYETPQALLVELETYFIAPLANEPCILLVMAGRGRPYPWKKPEVRLNIQAVPLGGFEEDKDIEEQIRKQVGRRPRMEPAEIKKWGDGVPLVNYLLGKYGREGLEFALEEMLEPVDADDRQRVREGVEAICMLRAFEEDRLQRMLAAYRGKSVGDYEAAVIRDLLVKWSLARFEREAGGYVLDGPVRKVAERHLEENHPQLWKKLHCAAYRLYEEWSKGRGAEWWKKEKDYHERRLEEKGIDAAECPPATAQEKGPEGMRACEEERNYG